VAEKDIDRQFSSVRLFEFEQRFGGCSKLPATNKFECRGGATRVVIVPVSGNLQKFRRETGLTTVLQLGSGVSIGKTRCK
jgi:hypothetical protein